MIRVLLIFIVGIIFNSCSSLPKGNLKKDVLARYKAPIKSYKTDASWERYKRAVLTPSRIKKAKNFIRKYKDELERAEEIYGVDKEYIVAFLAIETNFCSYTGNRSVYDVLWTLSHNKNRMQNFFKKEFEALQTLAKLENKDIRSYRGSFAGAMGCVQQLPSVHLKYGVDFDGDGKKDLYSLVDSIGTIASFMHRNGWEKRKKVAVRARYKGNRYFGELETGYNRLYSLATLKKYGIIPREKSENIVSLLQLRGADHDELWLGQKNMRVLTAYNHSTNYGMALYKFAQRLKGRR
jgi:membrane-bound lytic murein transglycosylase B